MNLAVCIPVSWDFVPTPFLISFAQLFRPSQLQAMRKRGIERYFHLFNRATPLDLNRNLLVKKSLELEADWILFLDADMTFPPELVPSLLGDAIETRSAVVSGCYFKKQPPHACVSANLAPGNDPQLLRPIDPAPEGLIDCDVIGMGAALIHCSVFAAVPYPWFEYEIHERTGERTVSEDVPFCRKAKDAGFRIVTDTRLRCGHLHQIEIEASHWLPYRERFLDQLAPASVLSPTEGV